MGNILMYMFNIYFDICAYTTGNVYLSWQVKSSDVRQSKILKVKWSVLVVLVKKELRKRDWQIGLVNSLTTGASLLTSKIIWC